jgi:dTDP-4-dehydrorhamnose 3,5-epimerase
MTEAKFLYVVTGSVLVCLIKIDNPISPSRKIKVDKFRLTEKNPVILCIPPGYANGFKPLEKRTTVIFFSNSSLKDSLKDDFRYPYDYWGKSVWK